LFCATAITQTHHLETMVRILQGISSSIHLKLTYLTSVSCWNKHVSTTSSKCNRSAFPERKLFH